ncbi:hypothetical protein C0J52_04513 [Blattella germanica]|nr:hypothetical protein C0J52_04513 [Blattella germanica]
MNGRVLTIPLADRPEWLGSLVFNSIEVVQMLWSVRFQQFSIKQAFVTKKCRSIMSTWFLRI